MKATILRLLSVLLLIALVASCSRQVSNTISEKEKEPNENAASQSTGKAGGAGPRKIKYYKSTMMLGEISQTPRKDSMGMDMVPVYEGEDNSTAISVDPVTVQTMGVRTAEVTRGPLQRAIRTKAFTPPRTIPSRAITVSA